MDPVLKRFKEKNDAHKQHLKKERSDMLKMLPLILILMGAYLGTQYFLLYYDERFLDIYWRGISKHVWFLALIFSSGIGSLFFSGSVAYVIWSSIIGKSLGLRISMLKSATISLVLLSISFILLFFGKWLHLKIVANNRDIAEFMTFGFRETPIIIELIFTFFNSIVCLFFFGIFITIMLLPFNAKKHAIEISNLK